jgi:hypothetical protein
VNILATVIPHASQRYPTTGDWYFEQLPTGRWVLKVLVSEMPDERYETLVQIHEIIEAALCKQAGIREEVVSEFDNAYEKARPKDFDYIGLSGYRCPGGCIITQESEPGDDIHAPYYRQHQLATSVERMLAVEMGVSWNEYEAANLALYEGADHA